jgi:hypothetical protein
VSVYIIIMSILLLLGSRHIAIAEGTTASLVEYYDVQVIVKILVGMLSICIHTGYPNVLFCSVASYVW